MIDVSFIIPIFNAEKTIYRCISSILKIMKFNVEVIIIDDGSTDKTSSVCEKFLKDKRVKYFKQNNSGVASSRNLGIFKAEGKYIFFVDSDDEINYEYTQILILETLENEADWSTAGYSIIKGSKKTDYQLNIESNICEFHGIENITQGYVWGKLYRTDIIKGNSLIFDKTMNYAEDLLFNLKYSLYVNKCIAIKECCYYYYLNDNSLSRKYCPNYIENIKKVRTGFNSLFDRFPDYENYYEKKFGSIELSIINNYIRNEFRNKKNKTIKNRIDFLKKSLESLNINMIKNENAKGIYNKLATLILKTKSPIIISCFYSLVNFIKG